MKKILLSLITFLSVAMCSVVAFIGLSSTPKTAIGGGHYKNIGEEVIIDNPTPKPIKKPSTITYAPNTISVQKGGNTINYSYTPSVNAQEDATPTHTVAYEYCFGNPMDRKTAINLKSIDTTGVNVSYYYSTSKIDTTSTLIGETDFELQELATSGTTGDQVYIYVLVSPTDTTIPTTFTQKVIWYYGIPKEVQIVDNITNTVIGTQTIVSGQAIDESTLDKPTAPDGYYFDAWFIDKEFIRLVDGTNTAGKNMYARFHNFPLNSTSYMTYTNGSYSVTSNPGVDNLIIPTIYNDGTNGDAFVTEIGSEAFRFNYYSDSITLPSSLTSIGSYAFSGCSHIVDMVIPEGVTSIGENAFEGSYFISITLPNTLTTIEEYAFSRCGIENVTIPSGLTSIASYAFADASIQSVTLPNTITSIGSYAFKACNSLMDINLPNSLTSIGEYAFCECYSLKSIILPEGLTSISDYSFYMCDTSTILTLPSSLTSIGDYAFSCCVMLTSVTIPEGVTSIGNCAFESCHDLTSITIPNSVTTIGESAFAYCYKLYEVYNLSNLNITKGSTDYGEVGAYAKVLHTSLSEPSVVITIGGVVYYMKNYSSYIAVGVKDSTITSITLDNRTTEIADSAFDFLGNLTSITIPEGVTSIDDSAFQLCSSLTSITIPSSVTKIGSYAFDMCSNLTSITFEDTSTWYYTSSYSYTGGTQIDVTDPSANATYFTKSTSNGGYYNYYWYKK